MTSLRQSSKVKGNCPVENMMGKICILVTLLLQLHPVSSVTDLRLRNFRYFANGLSWKHAQTHCRRQFTDLVTIRNETENRLKFHGWIGLYRNDSHPKWRWSRGDEIANYTVWANGHPFDGHNCAYTYNTGHPFDGHNCAYTYNTGYLWYSDLCRSGHSHVCYNEKLGLVKEKKTWEEALVHCRNIKARDSTKPPTAYQNHRYDLATLISDDDHDFAIEKAQDSDSEVWIGLRYLSGQWLWVGGGPMVYTNVEGCPSQRTCGILMKNGTISIRDCSQKRNFLCYKRHPEYLP